MLIFINTKLELTENPSMLFLLDFQILLLSQETTLFIYRYIMPMQIDEILGLYFRDRYSHFLPLAKKSKC